jgi:sugar (pentulose or hexulose) kinase
MSSNYLLAIDCGTQSVRALVFDLGGHLVDKAQVALDSYATPEPGWVESDPEDFWRALCQACQHLWANTSVPKSAIRGVVLTTQRATVVNLDAHGQPLRPAIVWLDQRRSDADPKLAPWWEIALRAVNMRDTIRYFAREAEANWIRERQPELWARTAKYLLLSGYLTHRLTDRYVDSVGCQVGYIPFDYKRQRWAAAGDWKWQAVRVEPHKLPELIPPGQRLGTITAAAAAATGIPLGLPLIAAAADKACEVLGVGSLSPETACLSYGTTATINVATDRYLEAVQHIPPFPAATPGAYNAEIQIYRGYWMVTWFRDNFGQPELERAAREGVAPEALLDQMIESIPPGADGLILHPYWSPGVREPGPEARGAILGFADFHTRAHVYRALLEGIAYALREGKERIEARTRAPLRRLMVAGGGARSDVAMQITADIFGLPATRPRVRESSALGAAIVAAVGLGLHPDFDTAVREMTRVGQTFAPDPTHARTYDALYRKVYCRMYQRLQPLYREIREITGYPGRR